MKKILSERGETEENREGAKTRNKFFGLVSFDDNA
jgi:hypothetical protein